MREGSMAPAPACATPAQHTSLLVEMPKERELIIDVSPGWWAEYEGTRAQLQAEGLIPDGLEWPRAAADKHWEANGFDYWLRRNRPEGHKGPMRTWLEMDNWFIRVQVTGRDWAWRARQNIEEKAKALRDEIYRQSDAGRREQDLAWGAWCKSKEDEAFQAFKAIFIPERKKPGRKPRGSEGRHA